MNQKKYIFNDDQLNDFMSKSAYLCDQFGFKHWGLIVFLTAEHIENIHHLVLLSI